MKNLKYGMKIESKGLSLRPQDCYNESQLQVVIHFYVLSCYIIDKM